ncbi:MAG: GNAT family N-acetyltransferase [Saprospiraceae bacterium]|nr:GNAT family N-acetyltransferase [Saprospiraceae bacterium]
MIKVSNINFRNQTREDMPFLKELYIESRRAEVDLLEGWSEEQKFDFLGNQFIAQIQYYLTQFKNAWFQVIEDLDQKPIGRLYLDERTNEIRIIDILISGSKRNKGIGTQIFLAILERGRKKNLPVRIHVEKNNPARSLYDRLGFQIIEDRGVYYLMEFPPRNDVK